LREAVIANLKSVFDGIYSVKIPEDVNETLYCMVKSLPKLDSTGNCKLSSVLIPSLINLQDTVQAGSQRPLKEVLQLSAKLEGLQLL